MAKKHNTRWATVAMISGTVLAGLSIGAFFITGESTIARMVIEYRSEIFGVAIGILFVGIISKLLGVKLA